MAPPQRASGGLKKWLAPTAILVIAIVLVLGTQMQTLPRGVAIVSAPKDRQLQARDIGGAGSSLTTSPSKDDLGEDEEPALVVEREEASNKGGGGGGGSTSIETKKELKIDDDAEPDKDDYSEEDYDYEGDNTHDGPDSKKESPAAPEEEEEEVEDEEQENVAEEQEDNFGTAAASPSSPELSSSLSPIIIEESRRFPPDMPFIQAIATCDTFECVRDAHRQPRKGARFNFPHFMIIGWQKSATTSLYVHLVRHKYIARSAVKEPEFFSKDCRFRVERCTPEDTTNYLHNTLNYTEFLKNAGNIATFEASTHYVRGHDRLPQGLYDIFPWVKLIIMMREPISRAMSMLIHNKEASQSGCLMDRSMADCLLTYSQISGDKEFPRSTNYSRALKVWLDSFPAGQVQVLQYEEIVSAPETSERYLRQVKKFIGVDPNLPRDASLPKNNMRKDHVATEGWEMTKAEYTKLVNLVKPDARAVAKMVSSNGFGDHDRWLGFWEDVWERNFSTCDENDKCTISVS